MLAFTDPVRVKLEPANLVIGLSKKLGSVHLPLCHRLCHPLPDRGIGFCRRGFS